MTSVNSVIPESKGKYVLYVGHNGFPSGMAQVERQKLIAKGLIAAGCDVLVICRYGVHDSNTAKAFEGMEQFEGVPFTYASGSPARESSLVKRTISKFIGLIAEARIIFKKMRGKEHGAILVTTNNFHNLVIYKS